MLNEDESYARINDKDDWVVSSTSSPGSFNIITDIMNENFSRFQNRLEAFPNPFNPSTVIEYEISEPMKVELRIYDILGREVWKLQKEKNESGDYSLKWNGKDKNGNELASGIYILNINGDLYNKSIKLMLIR